ncbi:MAG: type VI secretion system contractile sheath large subunit [Desulfovibrio sp.]|nr:type VI secretion system contractile sheath large subunit [Desulfovibrio sp.]
MKQMQTEHFSPGQAGHGEGCADGWSELVDRLASSLKGFSRRSVALGLEALVHALRFAPPSMAVDAPLVELVIAEIDARLSDQMNAILHYRDFMSLESAWRGMHFLVSRLRFSENIVVQILNASKQDLLADFEDASEIVYSGLYRHIYVEQYGQYGGTPVGAMLGLYEFGVTPQDMRLLSRIAAVAAMAHAPFLGAAGKSFFNIGSWEELPNIKDLGFIYDMPKFAAWRSFRESGDARYCALLLPRFLLRAAYSPVSFSVASFSFREDTSDTELACWGSPCLALADRLGDSFARYRWCVNIVGPEDGAVKNLPTDAFESMNALQKKIPLEVIVSESREFELSRLGFCALALLKGADSAAFLSASSCQRPMDERPGESSERVLSWNLSRQLPYMFLITRLAHYIKVIQRENIGTWKSAKELECEINAWLAQYVTVMNDPDKETRSRRPFNYARVEVAEEGAAGWYRVLLRVRPHFRYMGMHFTLALTGKLDR